MKKVGRVNSSMRFRFTLLHSACMSLNGKDEMKLQVLGLYA